MSNSKHIKRILVPTDFTPCAQAACHSAMILAVKSKAELYFLHLHSPEPTGGHMAMHGSSFQESHHHDCTGTARAGLDQLVREAEHQGLVAKPVLVMSENWDEVEQHAKAFSVDLVVMGSHSSKGLRRLLLGSNAVRMIHQASMPVMIVKSETREFKLKKIVFLSTLNEKDHEALAFLSHFALPWNATISILYVNTSNGFLEVDVVMSKMRSATIGLESSFDFHIYHSATKESGLSKFTEEIHADLVALPSQTKNVFASMISHGLAENFANNYQQPILVINAN